MVKARARTVLTPAVPRETKAKPEAPERPLYPGQGRARYRVRLLDGSLSPVYSEDLAEMVELRDGMRDAGMEAALEEYRSSAYQPVYATEPVTAADLARRGLARDVGGRWLISPEGYALINTPRALL